MFAFLVKTACQCAAFLSITIMLPGDNSQTIHTGLFIHELMTYD